MEGFILRLIVKRFQRSCYVIWGTDILFEKLTPEIGGWIWKTPNKGVCRYLNGDVASYFGLGASSE